MIAWLFDRIGSAITSLGAVIFVMLMTIMAMILFSHTLFLQVFPDSMENWIKILATWAMALAWEFTVLITTCNTRHLNKRIPGVMAIASGVIVLFFIQAFDSSITSLQMVQRWFVGVLAACINYIYADLFYAKWQERHSSLTMPARVIELEGQVNEFQRKFIQLESELNQRRSERNELDRELKELHSFKKRIERELTCPHCKESQQSYGTLHAHKGHCLKNPKKINAA